MILVLHWWYKFITYVQKWLMFPMFYRVAKHGEMTRWRAVGLTLSSIYGLRVKRVWRVRSLVRLLRQRSRVCPDRSRHWVFRTWWRHV